ncbi:MAG: polymerase [Sulfurimonas sp.]|nr:MAG: polymerase [Sulfurimonas sp.]
MINTFNNILLNIKPSEETQNKITLWLNHLLVVYAFLIPIHDKSKSSLFFVILILFVVRMDYMKYLKDAFSNKVVQAFVLFYLVWCFGFLYSDNLEYAQDSIRKAKYLMFPLLFLTFLDQRFSYRVISAFVLGMLFSELVSYGIRFELFPYELYFAGYEVYTTFMDNPSPFFKQIDHNIGLSVVVALLLYQLLNKSLSLQVRLLSVFFIITASLNMTFIGSRTGYILYLFLITIVLLITYKKNLTKACLISLVIFSILPFLAYSYSDMINKRVDLTLISIDKMLHEDYYNSSLGKRIGATKESFKVIRENLFFGVGTGDYMDELRNTLSEKNKFIGVISQPHNVYIKTLLQFGLFGLFFLFFLFYRLLTYKSIDEYNKGIIILLTLAVMLFMLPGKFYGYFILPMFVTLLSAMVVQNNRNIDYKQVDMRTLCMYGFLTFGFLIIGITK